MACGLNLFKNMDYLEFCVPLLVPVGLCAFSLVLESITQKGQVLSAAHGVKLPFKGIKKALTHFSSFMHTVYLACFAFDLSAMVNIYMQLKYNNPDMGISYSGKTLGATMLWLLSGIIIHCLAYFHTVFILHEVEVKRRRCSSEDEHNSKHHKEEKIVPMTYLHLLYLPLSIFLVLAIRW